MNLFKVQISQNHPI